MPSPVDKINGRSLMEINHRRCISCRKTAPKSEFWRIVRTHPDHTIALDQGMGRSAYLCPTPDCLKAAQKKERLSRVLKTPVPELIFQTLKERLPHHTIQSP
ncbi:YlxR family protein [Phormidesmis sp. 146-35]